MKKWVVVVSVLGALALQGGVLFWSYYVLQRQVLRPQIESLARGALSLP